MAEAELVRIRHRLAPRVDAGANRSELMSYLVEKRDSLDQTRSDKHDAG